MLQFVLGRAGSGKTEYMRRLLADRALAGQGGTVMLVPEQYTFETEKAMLRLAGPVRGNAIPVYSFTRLAEAVFRREGGAVGRRLSDGGRRILMASAIEACQDRLEVYAAAAQSGRVNDVMLTAVNEMKMCGIAPGDLREAARGLGGRGLGKKLSELALLYDTYNGLVEASYLDSRDDLTRLAQALEGSAFFQGCTVAVDSFEGFTAQELKVLVQILRQADQVVVALCTDGLDTTGTGLFALVDRTLHRLSAAARENGVAIQPPVVLTGAPRFQNENLKLVEAQLFCAQETLTSPDCQGITVLEAKDPYEEAEFAAATIRRLVAEEGYRYREISIICRDPRPVLRLPGRRPEKAGHPLLCVPARQGGRRARHPVCAGGLPGGAGGLSDRGPAGAAENRRLRLYRRGDCQPGELRLFVEALRPGMAPGIHPPPPGLWPGAHPGGPGGACPPQRPAPAAHGPLRALRRPHPGGHRRGDLPGGVPAAAGL